MSNAPKTAANPSEPEKKSGGLIPIALMAIVAGGISFGAAYTLTPKPEPVVAVVCKGDELTKLAEVPKQIDATYVDLDEILITIGSAPATRYLKMQLTISTSKDGVSYVEDAQPLLTDAFLTYLRSIEMADFERPAFYSQMRGQLSRRADLVLGPSVSDGVLITEFLLR